MTAATHANVAAMLIASGTALVLSVDALRFARSTAKKVVSWALIVVSAALVVFLSAALIAA